MAEIMGGRSDIGHIIWDWNGTLLDDVAACVTAISRMLEKRGLPRIDERQYRDRFGFPVKKYYVTLGFDMGREDWDSMAREFHGYYADAARGAALREGIVYVLDRLRKRGIPMSVLSASEQTILTSMMEERGLLGYFDQVRGLSDLYAHSKAQLGRELMAGLPVGAKRVWLVGDTTHDHEVALDLECRCVLLEGGHQAGERLRRCGCPVAGDARALAGVFDL